MAVLNGNTYTNSMFTGLGYVDYFPEPIFSDMLAELQSWLDDFETLRDTTEGFRDEAEDFAADAEAAAIAAAAGAATLQATSTSSITIGSGAKSATITAGKNFIVGMPLRFSKTSDPVRFFIAVTTAYNSVSGAWTGTVGTDDGTDYDTTGGAGPHTDWTISFGGWEGPAGADSWNTPVEVTNAMSPYAPVDGDILLVNPASGVDIVTQTNTPSRFSIIPQGTISASNFIRVAPPTGKTILGQATDDRVLIRKQIKGISFYKDSSGNYR